MDKKNEKRYIRKREDNLLSSTNKKGECAIDKKYYKTPVQLRVEDPNGEEGKYLYGIGFGKVFICGCCGNVFELEELEADGLEITELDWVDISGAI